MDFKKVAYIVDSSIGLYDSNILSDNTKQVFFRISDSSGNEYLDDNKSLKPEYILEKLKENVIFKTSAVSPGLVLQELEGLLENYDRIILFTISSGISSFYENIKFLEEEFKDRFFVIDTKEIGHSIHFLLKEVKKQIEENKPFNEVIDFANNYYKKNITFFTCETWEPLAKSGRAPTLLAKAFDKINTKPIINFFIKNRLLTIAFGKGEKGFYKSIEKIIQYLKKIAFDLSENNIEYCVFYNNMLSKSRADYIRNNILYDIFKVAKNKIIESFVPNVVLVHTGYGSFGFNFRFKNKIKNRE